MAITSPTNNCSGNQGDCESVMGGIFKTTSECTTTTTTTPSISSDNSTPTTTNDDESGSQEQEVIAVYDDGCDESKCVTRGFYQKFDNSFTCYTDKYPMMCADGYQPHIVENEDTLIYRYYDETTIYYYFTCCPPN